MNYNFNKWGPHRKRTVYMISESTMVRLTKVRSYWYSLASGIAEKSLIALNLIKRSEES